MSSPEETINQFLQTMGLSGRLTAIPSAVPGVSIKTASVNHLNVPLTLVLEENDANPGNAFFRIDVAISFFPKVNVAPFLRRLLILQSGMGGVFFFMNEANNVIGMRVGRFYQGLDFTEFQQMVNQFVTTYWQRIPGLVQEFQLPQQPS
jgi:hypothetical protein